MASKISGERLIEILENVGQEPRSYSGRGMYGNACVAFTVESGSELGIVADIATSIDEQEEQYRIVKLFQSAKTDGMGRDSIVIYFPSVEWPTA